MHTVWYTQVASAIQPLDCMFGVVTVCMGANDLVLLVTRSLVASTSRSYAYETLAVVFHHSAHCGRPPCDTAQGPGTLQGWCCYLSASSAGCLCRTAAVGHWKLSSWVWLCRFKHFGCSPRCRAWQLHWILTLIIYTPR